MVTLGIDIGGTNLSLGLVENDLVVRGFSVPSFAPDASMEQTLESYLPGRRFRSRNISRTASTFP